METPITSLSKLTIRLTAVAPVIAILGVYAAFLTLVPPTGEFPSLDDFDYSASAWHLLETGTLRLSDWPAMTLVFHVAWGSLFSMVGGHTFLALRISMFVMSAVTTFAIFAWTRRCGHRRSVSVWLAVVFAINPLAVDLQFQQDGLERSRTFWSTVSMVHEQGVEPGDIDAGLAYAGYYRFNPNYRGADDSGPFLDRVPPEHRDVVTAAISPLSITRGALIHISFRKETGYQVIASRRYESWFRSGEVFVQFRADLDQSRLPSALRGK